MQTKTEKSYRTVIQRSQKPKLRTRTRGEINERDDDIRHETITALFLVKLELEPLYPLPFYKKDIPRCIECWQCKETEKTIARTIYQLILHL